MSVKLKAVFKENSKYTYSPIQTNEFRLARLQPALSADDPICCSIVSTADFTTIYEALSYTWGNPELSWTDVLLDDRSHSVPANLGQALRSLRLKDGEKILWVDWICIDQTNVIEKSHQVTIVPDIFQSASQVYVWLGTGDESSKTAMHFIGKLDTFSNFDRVVHDSGFDEEWRAVVRLICVPWFNRVWVVQEISVAQKAIIWCGSVSVDWKQLETCLALLIRKSQVSTEYGTFKALGASLLMDVVNKAFKRNELGKTQDPILSLETLVTTLSSFKSSLPQDCVYGLLGIANDTGKWSRRREQIEHKFETTLNIIKVDYSSSFSQVCDEFVSFSISRSRSLDIIFRPWAPLSADSNLSSWTCPLDLQAFKVRSDDGWPEVIRVNADPFVSPSGTRSTYSASGTSQVQEGWHIRGPEGSKTLRVMGKIVDSILETTSPAWNGNTPIEWFEFASNLDDNDDGISEEFWNTLVAGRSPDGINGPPYCPTASHRLRDEISASALSGVVDVNRIQREEPGTIRSEFWRRAQCVIWGRTLILTKERRLGLVPGHAQEGDCKSIKAHQREPSMN